MNHARVVPGQSLITSSHTTVVLQFLEEPFDQITLFIKLTAIRSWVDSSTTGGDGWFSSASSYNLDKGV